MASGGLDWAFISVAPASRLASTSYLPAFVRAGLPHHSQFEDLRPTVISFRSIASFSLLTPSLPFGPVHPSIHCIYLPSPPPPPLPPSFPHGSDTANPVYRDGTTIRLPDPSTAEGSLSRIHTQPWRPATHDFVLGYWNFISSRLARRCQSRQ